MNRRSLPFVPMVLAAAVLSVACASTDDVDVDSVRERLLSAALAELREGFPVEAEDALARAAVFGEDHPGVLLLQATLATMHWDDHAALEKLLRLRQVEIEPYLSKTELDGRIGDLLVRLGEHRRAELALRLSVDGSGETVRSPEGTRRAALAAVASRLPERRAEPTTLATELPLVSDVFPKLLCRFGRGDAAIELPFVLDTGAVFTTVQESVARRLGVDTVEPALTVSDGRGRPVEARFGVLPSMSLGVGVAIGPRPVLVVEDSLLPASEDTVSADAVVGLDLLSRYRVTLDPARSSARFELPLGQELDAAIETLRCDGRIMVPVECEGVRLWFALDTGATATSLTPKGLRTLPGGDRRARNTLGRVSGPGGSSAVVQEVRGLILQIGRLRVAGSVLPVVDRYELSWFPVHGVLGADILSECRITLDSGRLRLESR